MAQEVLEYMQGNPLVSLAIAIVAGYAAYKSVVHVKKGNPALFFVVGVLGFFLGQFAILYFGVGKYLDEISEFRLLFDLIAAYIGSFVLASLIHFVKPL
jgi:uncharacterized membrane protein YeaQ/YmgE (transglycosylase-associated protein family)